MSQKSSKTLRLPEIGQNKQEFRLQRDSSLPSGIILDTSSHNDYYQLETTNIINKSKAPTVDITNDLNQNFYKLKEFLKLKRELKDNETSLKKLKKSYDSNIDFEKNNGANKNMFIK